MVNSNRYSLFTISPRQPARGLTREEDPAGRAFASGVVHGCSATAQSIPETSRPAGFAEKFSKENSKIDDPKAFPSKKELVELLSKTRQKTVAWAKGLSDADMAKPVVGNMNKMCPTVAHMALMQIGHIAMHVGQFQVIRRKLGKPILF